jgi:hypothetical protein
MIYSTQIRRALLLIFVSLFATVGFGQQKLDAVGQPLPLSELHVLFIGNSFTYFNNMPRMVEAISESVDGPRIQTEMVAIGGARLEDLWKQGAAIAAIRRQHWNFVVLNEQSSLGGGIVNGEKRIGSHASYFKYAGMFDAEIRAAGARTVIMMTWKDRNDPVRIQTELDSVFSEFSRTHEALLAHVSLAWDVAVTTPPEINLYFADNHHPSSAGSYLAACTIYATIAKYSPKGATAKIDGTPVENERGTIQYGKTKTLVNLSPRTAARLQQFAWQATAMFMVRGIE